MTVVQGLPPDLAIADGTSAYRGAAFRDIRVPILY